MSERNRLEILSPVGDMERLYAALDFGADAVYLGGTMFGMRAQSAKFDPESLKLACDEAHRRGKRLYLTCNTLPRNQEIPLLEGFIKDACAAGVDALITTDIGVFMMIRRIAPDMEIHVSTQAGIVNYAAAREFYEMGAKRVVLARELSLDEIAEIRAKTPKELEIEVFVHGAMCMSFSGRCLISQYLTDRDPNRGQCAQPCRWNYTLMEEKRPGEYYPVIEEEQGSYILNAKDLCMIDHIDKLAEAGVDSFKLEGRAKSTYYVAVVTNAYRMAMDIYKKEPNNFKLPDWIRQEVYNVSHRPYCTGFFFGHPKDCQYYADSSYIRDCEVVAIVRKCENGRIYAAQRNKFFAGDTLEALIPNTRPIEFKAEKLFNSLDEPIETANKAAEDFSIASDLELPPNTMLRIRK
ncbi:MAG: U32 family peptidase [Ruminococcus sp.]|nr:U32 family peptidase [Ruminococcus sp.]